MATPMDPVFGDAVRDLLVRLAAGDEPGFSTDAGGGLSRVLRETSAPTPRAAVEVLVDRWFRAAPSHARVQAKVEEPLLNRPDVGESEKLHATLREHVVGQCRWQELSNNESTFY